MNTENLSSKLTPAAKEVLDEVVGDYKFQLLREANKNASDITGEVREISVRDILDTLQKVEASKINKRAKLFERLLMAYAFFGIMISLVSSLMTQLGILSSRYSELFGLTGSLLALVSLIAYYLNVKRVISIGSFVVSKRDTSPDTKDYSMFFVMKWREIEILSREVVAYYIGESNIDNMSVRDLLNNLLKFDVFNLADSKLFLNLLEKRNSLVHTQTLEMTISEYTELESIADIILKKLRAKKENTANS